MAGREAAAEVAVGELRSVCVPGLRGSLSRSRSLSLSLSLSLTCLVCTEARDIDVLPHDSEAAAEPGEVRVGLGLS